MSVFGGFPTKPYLFSGYVSLVLEKIDGVGHESTAASKAGTVVPNVSEAACGSGNRRDELHMSDLSGQSDTEKLNSWNHAFPFCTRMVLELWKRSSYTMHE